MDETLPESDASVPRPQVAYASFTRRFRALVLDSLVLTGGFAALLVLGEMTRDVPGSGVTLGLIVIGGLLLYEPVLVWLHGGTVGHRAANLCVVDERAGGNPTFLRAFARFVIKTVLGIPSFITMALTRRHQAVHDLVTGTTVRVRDVEKARAIDFHYERVDTEPAGAPSRTRRVIVAATYALLAYVGTSIVGMFVLSEACALDGQCTPADDLRASGLGLAWLGLTAAAIVGAWRARLWGCRTRSERAASDVQAI